MREKNALLEDEIIFNLIEPSSKVLVLGCGEGKLLERLVRDKKIFGQGLEINNQAIFRCVERGLNVLHGDIEAGLSEYRDNAFDYVVMKRTFQELEKPGKIIMDSLRVGKKLIVSFPNFLYLSSRLQFLLTGRVPVNPSLPHEWYDTPNLHFLSIKDFDDFCAKRNIIINERHVIGRGKRVRILSNLLGEVAVYLISLPDNTSHSK